MFENFEQRLRESLKNAGYTISKATEELGLSKNAITNYMKGRIPTGEILYKLSQLCGVSMEYLLTGVNNTDKVSDITSEEYKIIDLYRMLSEKNKYKSEVYMEMKLEEQNNKKGDSKSLVSSNTKVL